MIIIYVLRAAVYHFIYKKRRRRKKFVEKDKFNLGLKQRKTTKLTFIRSFISFSPLFFLKMESNVLNGRREKTFVYKKKLTHKML